MKYKIIKGNDYITTRWSGGTTSQIMISPDDAVFSHMNFRWRISRATVEDGRSEFTRMPGYHRILHLLEGETKLVFEEKGKNDQNSTGPAAGNLIPSEPTMIKVLPGNTIRFDGNQKIISYGGGADLNLIMGSNVSGKIISRSYAAGEALKFGAEMIDAEEIHPQEILMYTKKGVWKIKDYVIEAGDSVYFNWNSSAEEKGEKPEGDRKQSDIAEDYEAAALENTETVIFYIYCTDFERNRFSETGSSAEPA